MTTAPSSRPVAEIPTAATPAARAWSSVGQRPAGLGAFEFVVLAGLRAGQLARGCTPRVPGAHKITVIAQLEVAAGKVMRQIKDTCGDIRFAR